MTRNILIHHRDTGSQRKTNLKDKTLKDLGFFVSQCLRGEWLLFTIRIPQIAFDGEVLSEAMQMDILDLRGLAHVAEAGACCKRNRPGTGENFRSVIQENFVNEVRR